MHKHGLTNNDNYVQNIINWKEKNSLWVAWVPNWGNEKIHCIWFWWLPFICELLFIQYEINAHINSQTKKLRSNQVLYLGLIWFSKNNLGKFTFAQWTCMTIYWIQYPPRLLHHHHQNHHTSRVVCFISASMNYYSKFQKEKPETVHINLLKLFMGFCWTK